MTGPQKASSLWLAQENQHLHMKIDALNAELLAAKALLQDNAAACTRLVDERDILRTENARLRAAATNLISKMESIYEIPGYKNVWSLAANHGMPYDGPTWESEFEALRVALSGAPGQ